MKGNQTVSAPVPHEGGGSEPSVFPSGGYMLFRRMICRERTQKTRKKVFPTLRSLCFFAAILCFSLLMNAAAWAAPRQILPGHLPAAVKNTQPLANLASSNRLHLVIGLPLRNQAALATLLQEIYDPASLNYHH